SGRREGRGRRNPRRSGADPRLPHGILARSGPGGASRASRVMKALPCLLVAATLFPAVIEAQNQLPPGSHAPEASTETPRETAEGKIEQKDFAGARAILKKYLAQQPDDARALFDLGYVEDASNQEDAAAAASRKAIEADP